MSQIGTLLGSNVIRETHEFFLWGNTLCFTYLRLNVHFSNQIHYTGLPFRFHAIRPIGIDIKVINFTFA